MTVELAGAVLAFKKEGTHNISATITEGIVNMEFDPATNRVGAKPFEDNGVIKEARPVTTHLWQSGDSFRLVAEQKSIEATAGKETRPSQPVHLGL